MFFMNSFHATLSQAVKLFGIIQFKQLKLKYAQHKISYAENCYNEHYENIIQETETEKLNDLEPLYTKKQRRANKTSSHNH